MPNTQKALGSDYRFLFLLWLLCFRLQLSDLFFLSIYCFSIEYMDLPSESLTQNEAAFSKSHVHSFLSLFFSLANSKSEGSPVLPHEPSKVKPEESRDITRPSRPAVSASLPKNLYVFAYLRILR